MSEHNSVFGWFQKGEQLIFMRSHWELNYAHYLNFLVKHKEIVSWEYEVDTFWFDKIRRGVVSYKPDFKVVNNDGSVAYHEVKGYMDSKSATKLKRMAKYHPDIKIILIDGKRYIPIARMQKIIPNWGCWIRENPNPPKPKKKVIYGIGRES